MVIIRTLTESLLSEVNVEYKYDEAALSICYSAKLHMGQATCIRLGGGTASLAD
jgi:hypothetical protein